MPKEKDPSVATAWGREVVARGDDNSNEMLSIILLTDASSFELSRTTLPMGVLFSVSRRLNMSGYCAIAGNR